MMDDANQYGACVAISSKDRALIKQAIQFHMYVIKKRMVEYNVEPRQLRFYTSTYTNGQYIFGWKAYFVSAGEPWMFETKTFEQ